MDEAGLYEWVRRDFRIFVQSGLIETLQSGSADPVSSHAIAQLSLADAKYAREWSLSSVG